MAESIFNNISSRRELGRQRGFLARMFGDGFNKGCLSLGSSDLQGTEGKRPAGGSYSEAEDEEGAGA